MSRPDSRWTSTLAVALLSGIAPAQQSAVDALCDRDWRVRNDAAASLVAEAPTAEQRAALWRLITDRDEFVRWPRLLPWQEDALQQIDEHIVPGGLYAPRDELVPLSTQDLVVAFRPRALAMFVFAAAQVRLDEAQWSTCLDFALEEPNRPEADLLAVLVAQRAQAATTELCRRLRSDDDELQSHGARVVLLRLLAHCGSPGRAALRELASDATNAALRGTALQVLGTLAWQDGDAAVVAEACLADADCAGVALGALQKQRQPEQRAAAVEALGAAISAGDRGLRRRAQQMLLSLYLDGPAKVAAGSAFHALFLRTEDAAEQTSAVDGMRRFLPELPLDVRAPLRRMAVGNGGPTQAARWLLQHRAGNDADLLDWLLQQGPELDRDLLEPVLPYWVKDLPEADACYERFAARLRATPAEGRIAFLAGLRRAQATEIDPGLPDRLRSDLASGEDERVDAAALLVALYPRDLRALEPDLRRALRTADDARAHLAVALARVAPAEMPSLIDSGVLEAMSIHVGEGLDGPLPLEALQALLHDRRRDVREAALAWIGEDPAAADVLVANITSDDHRLRLWCLNGLYWLQGHGALPPAAHELVRQVLRERLADTTAPVEARLDASAALGELDMLGPTDVAPLVGLQDFLDVDRPAAWRAAGMDPEHYFVPPTLMSLLFLIERVGATPATMAWLEQVAAEDALESDFVAAARLLRRKLGPRR